MLTLEVEGWVDLFHIQIETMQDADSRNIRQFRLVVETYAAGNTLITQSFNPTTTDLASIMQHMMCKKADVKL